MASDRYAATAIDELPQLWDGFAKLVREGLEITGFGVQIMDLPPDYTTKSHNEGDSGQEELYMGLRGSGAVVIDDEDRVLTLDPEHVVRVSSGVSAGCRARRTSRRTGRAASNPRTELAPRRRTAVT
jgi:hypothetical protein